jgi:hypothetical protein
MIRTNERAGDRRTLQAWRGIEVGPLDSWREKAVYLFRVRLLCSELQFVHLRVIR